jgi:hypothetical protein
MQSSLSTLVIAARMDSQLSLVVILYLVARTLLLPGIAGGIELLGR